jgi:predicted metal-dependent hydrolase
VRERDSVRFGDATIEYEVRRSVRRKKTVQITVERGGVLVVAPSATPKKELRSIVLKRAGWILRQASTKRAEAPTTRFVSGETFPYLGDDFRLALEMADGSELSVSFEGSTLHVFVPAGLPDADRAGLIRSALIDWYCARAAQHFPDHVDRWWSRLGRGDKPRILIRNQRRRWGSCAWDGTLRFNWRVMMLEPALVDYIVAHELAHLTVKNHSSDFWSLVARHVPDVKRRRQRLRAVESALPL